MANSTCAKCGGHSFEICLSELAGDRYRRNLVQCASCGTPIGVLEGPTTAAQLEELKTQIKTMATGIEELKHRIVRIEHAVSREP